MVFILVSMIYVYGDAKYSLNHKNLQIYLIEYNVGTLWDTQIVEQFSNGWIQLQTTFYYVLEPNLVNLISIVLLENLHHVVFYILDKIYYEQIYQH